jgi:hypothetical protein
MRVPVAPQTDFVPGPRPARISCAQEVRRERRRLAGFLVAEGVDDWVVLHGGATPVFKVGSIAEAARLAAAVAESTASEDTVHGRYLSRYPSLPRLAGGPRTNRSAGPLSAPNVPGMFVSLASGQHGAGL